MQKYIARKRKLCCQGGDAKKFEGVTLNFFEAQLHFLSISQIAHTTYFILIEIQTLLEN